MTIRALCIQAPINPGLVPILLGVSPLVVGKFLSLQPEVYRRQIVPRSSRSPILDPLDGDNEIS
jgi:hypothetical protein